MNSALKIITSIRKETEEVILFHSGTGKDSILLLHLLCQKFTKVHAIFMYICNDLEYENKYIEWAKNKYPNAVFYKTPHYAVYSFIKTGYLGMKKDESISRKKIKDIDLFYRKETGVNFSIYGFKKIDGITRRFMLNETNNGIHEKTNKAYPLMDMTNSDVISYIREYDLIEPFNYGTSKPSSGCDISTPEFLSYLKNRYPNDLEKIFNVYPKTRLILARYEQVKAI